MRASEVRRANRGVVLDELGRADTLTRSHLSELTSLTPQALGPILTGLVDEGLVEEKAASSTGRGRPAISYSLAESGSMSATLVQRYPRDEVYLTNARGDVAAYRKLDHQTDQRAKFLIQAAVDQILDMIDEGGFDRSRLDHVGLAIEGAVDDASGIVHEASTWVEREVDLRALAGSLLPDVDLRITSSARAMAARAIADLAPPPDELGLVLFLGFGVWLFPYRGGEVISSQSGLSGHLDHVPIAGNDEVCRCGQIGCFATVTGLEALVEQYEIRTGERVGSGADVLKRMFAGDEIAADVTALSCDWLARGIAPLISLLDPDRLIVTGTVPGADHGHRLLLAEMLDACLRPAVGSRRIDVLEPELNRLIWQ